MVTRWPLVSQSLCPHAEFKKSKDLQHIERVSFTDDDIKSYVEITSEKQPFRNSSGRHQVICFFQSFCVLCDVYIPSMCYSRTHCTVQSELEKKKKSYAPSTLTQLYTDLLHSLLRRYTSMTMHPDCKEELASR